MRALPVILTFLFCCLAQAQNREVILNAQEHIEWPGVHGELNDDRTAIIINSPFKIDLIEYWRPGQEYGVKITGAPVLKRPIVIPIDKVAYGNYIMIFKLRKTVDMEGQKVIKASTIKYTFEIFNDKRRKQ